MVVSMALVLAFFFLQKDLGPALDHLAAAVLTAVAARAVRKLHFPAIRAVRRGGALEGVMSPALVTAGLRMASFRFGHGRRASLSLGSL